MDRSNAVFQVLVVDPSKAPIGAGSAVEDLTEGQIGIFDASTNLAIDGTEQVRNFYMAVGIDSDGDGQVDTIDKSCGQLIQARNITGYTFRPHTAAQPMVVEFTGYKPKCGADYGIRLEFRNQQVYDHQGFNQFSKSYVIHTEECADCGDECEPANVNLLTQNLIREINYDNDDMVTAVAIATEALVAATQGTSQDYAEGDEISEDDLQVLVDFNEAQEDETTKVSTGIRLTTKPIATRRFVDINTRYQKPRGTIIIPSMIAGFGTQGSFETTQEAAFEEGNGYDLRYREYCAAGYNGRGGEGVYRTYANTGLAREIDYRVDQKAKYDVISLSYNQHSRSAWLEYSNALRTEIGIPTFQGVSTAAKDGILLVLDRIVDQVGLDSLSDDAASASDNPELVEKTEDKTADTDGIA
jgi:hypothetical protein